MIHKQQTRWSEHCPSYGFANRSVTLSSRSLRSASFSKSSGPIFPMVFDDAD
jgi:hypothetical protein